MRYFLLTTLFVFPFVAFASCTTEGSTVIYVNGIFSTLRQAQNDLTKLETKFYEQNNDRQIKFLNGYNPSHLGGFDDLLKTIVQAQLWSKDRWNEDVDGDTILNQIHDDLTTQKVLLVGHSQGAFYANETYKYLISHGVSAGAAAVYNVGNVASYTAGGGDYLTSLNDDVVNDVRRARKS